MWTWVAIVAVVVVIVGGFAWAAMRGRPATPSTPVAGSVHSGGVDQTTYQQVLAAIKAGGFTVSDESGLVALFGSDKQHVAATMGGMKDSKGKQVVEVDLQLKSGKWRVIGNVVKE
jgi:hypothetical protein